MRLPTLIATMLLLLGMCSALTAEDDPGPALAALAALATEVADIRKGADAALKGKDAAAIQKAYQDIDALVAKFETWEEAAHKGGWGDEKIEAEQKKVGWNALLDVAKKLKAAGAGAK